MKLLKALRVALAIVALFVAGCLDTTFGTAPDGATWYSGNRKMVQSDREAEMETKNLKLKVRTQDDVSPEMVKLLAELRGIVNDLKSPVNVPIVRERLKAGDKTSSQ